MTEPSSRLPLRIPALAGLYQSLSGWSYPVIRFAAGLFLMPHGAQKLFGLWGGDIDRTAAFFAKIGLVPGLPLAYLVGLTELVGGLCIAIGFLTRPAAAAAAVLLLVAAFKVHLANGFFWNNGGYEYPLLWAIVLLAIFVNGAGGKSVDGALGKEF